jgi:DNA-binding NarL/FixJ family response regulator
MLTRLGLAQLLRELGHEVVAETADADALLASVRATQPQMVITDIRMPPSRGNDGLVAAKQVRAEYPNIKVLVLSQYVEPSYALTLLGEAGGGCGYLLKDRLLEPAVLADALDRLHRGESVIDPDIVAQLMNRRRSHDPVAGLAPREREVLAQLAEGRSNAAIADVLHMSERTVEAHTTTIFQKLDLQPSPDVHRRVQAVVTFLRSAPPDASP